MSELNSHVCFDALATLQNIQNIEQCCCNFCGGAHTIQDCPELSKGEHIFDNCLQDLSRSSVPSGLHVIEHNVPCVITSQKFAKGSRFGPLLAKKSYIPIENLRFPLIIFGNIIPDLNIPELEELFKVRNIYLDTTNENECNWMVHVNPAEYLNEQNLIAYQEDNQIYFTAIHDIEVGDILKVWYAPSYAAKMCIPLLQPSQYEIVNNILRQVSIDHSSLKVEADDESFNCEPVYYNNNVHHSTDVSLPPIQSIFTAQGTFPKTEYLTPDLHTYNNHMDIVPYDPAVAASACHADVLDISMTNSDESFTTSTPTHSTEFNNNIEMKPIDGTDGSVSTAIGEAKIKKEPQTKKKNYQCQFCDKSYATMTNIYKHMRTHDLYLCSLCMKTFQEESEIKQHNCGTTGVKKPQCMVCFKYLSNACSLTRHMKIHPKGRGNECNKTTTMTSPLEAELFEQNSLLSDDVTTDLSGMMMDNNPEDDQSVPKMNKRFPGIVCMKKFKTNELLQKHLKDVHTVKTFKIKKNATTSDNVETSSPNKSSNNDCNSHNSLPVKQSIAIALAYKLNKKNTTTLPTIGNPSNDVEMMPKLIPIASEATSCSPFKEYNESLHPVLVPYDGDQYMASNDFSTLDTTANMVEDVEESILASAVPRPNVKHQCNVCNKVFNKTNQLKRHKETHENIIYICPFCDNKSVKTKKTILKHLRTNHPDQQSDLWNSSDFINSLAMRSNYAADLNATTKSLDDNSSGSTGGEIIQDIGTIMSTSSSSTPPPTTTLMHQQQQQQQIKYDDDHLLNNKINLNNATTTATTNAITNKLERSNKLFVVNECDSKSAKDSKFNLVLSKKNNIELMKDIYQQQQQQQQHHHHHATAKHTNFGHDHDDISKNHHFGDRNIVDGQFAIGNNCNSDTTSKLTKIEVALTGLLSLLLLMFVLS